MRTKQLQTKSNKKPKPKNKGRIIQIKSGLFLEVSGIDHRTKLGRIIRELKKNLREYVGASNPATEMLISRISYKHVKLSLYEAIALENLENDDHEQYMKLSNSLNQDLRTLQKFTGESKAPDLGEYLNTTYTEKL